MTSYICQQSEYIQVALISTSIQFNSLFRKSYDLLESTTYIHVKQIHINTNTNMENKLDNKYLSFSRKHDRVQC